MTQPKLTPPPPAEPRPIPAPLAQPKPTPAPALRPVAVVKPASAPQAKPSASPVATLERPAPRQIATVVLAKAPPAEPEDELERPRLATRVAALPRVLLDTVAWGGFAAVVALIVIALSDVGMGRAALWAVGLSGIVVLAVAVMAVTGTHLDELSHAGRATEGPD
ncbi:hypothetical protein [Sporichthya sp.]|uniref:hypothetical protein n=1 Tax=Sporichthya sp. TaxID=65475 RepID=UPI0017A1DD95|nr:hypothetical protein [Sporichthya sp.]MBA3743296.1 hypothetical protein [Sporichthya sp.]